MPRAEEATDALAPLGLPDAHPRWTLTHAREGAAVGGVLVWPALSVGPVFDSNPDQQHRSGRGGAGFGVIPAFLAERRSGPGRTELYGAGDIRVYPDGSAPNVTNGRAGILQDWAPRPDFAVRVQGEVARRTDPFNTVRLLSAGARRGLIFETDTLGSASVQKFFGRVFVSFSGTALRATFGSSGHARADAGRLSPETVATVKGRVGYLLPAGAFVFAEPSANWRSLDRLRGESSGTRAVAGIGAARLGLLSGEVYAGQQQQSYSSRPTAVSAPVVGGRFAWTPTRLWTVAAQYDQSLGQVAIGTAVDPLGTPSRTDAALLTVDWAASRLWTVRATGGAVWVDYLGTRRTDRLTFADLRVDYAVTRSLDLTGLVRAAALRSSVGDASYDRTIASLSATYHY